MTQILDTPTLGDEETEELLFDEPPWAVVVWNDDVNTFAYVTKALIEILRHSTVRARQLTLRIHNSGKAVVAVRPKDEAVAVVHRFHERGIGATAEPA